MATLRELVGPERLAEMLGLPKPIDGNAEEISSPQATDNGGSPDA